MQTQRPMIQDRSEIGLQLKNMSGKMLLLFRTTERALYVYSVSTTSPFEDVPRHITYYIFKVLQT